MNKKHILKIDNRDEVNGKKSILNLQNIRKVYSKEGVDFLLANSGPTGTSSLALSGTDLIFTDNAGGNTTVSLASFIDDTNLARLVSGTLDGTGLATFTRDDSSTFTVDFAPLFDNTNLARIISGAVAGTNIVFTRDDSSTFNVDVSAFIDAADLASNSNGLGASLVGIEDVAGNFTGTTVEDVLAEIVGNLPVSSYTDNGDGTYTLSDGNGGTPTVLDTNADSSFIGANITIGATTFVAGTNTVQEVLEALVAAIEIRDRIVDPNVSGTYNLDHSLATDWKLTLTGATSLADINFPPKTMEFTLKITGDFPLSVPSYWDMNGETYDGTGWNFFAIQLHDSTPSSEEVTVFLTNIV